MSTVVRWTCCFLVASTCMGIWPPSDSVADSVTIPISKDTFVSSLNPNSNYGNYISFVVGYDGPGSGSAAFLYCSMSTIPTGSWVESAVLSVYCETSIATGAIDVWAPSGSWGEYSLTWSNAPYLRWQYASLPTVTEHAWNRIDVTELVRDWVGGSYPNYGLEMETVVAGAAAFATREYGSEAPYLTVTYTPPTGDLRVTIAPQAVIDAGAQWRVDGGVWRNSGTTVSGIVVGTHIVSFKSVTGWTRPGDLTVGISDDQTTTASGTYTQQVGSLTVTISPQEAINAGAQWNVDGGAWQNSGGIVSNLLIGTHTVSFRDVSGWAKPGGQTVTISNNQTTSASGTYTQQVGSLTVTISPQEAINAGAQWNVDGGAWQNSGGIVSNLLIGTHTVSFRDVSGWAKPGGQTVTISNNQTTSASGTYTQQVGSLTVTISPQEAINAGAQWNVDGGAWQNSGGIVSNLLIGTHTVSFRDVSGWAKPGGQTVTISNNQTTSASGTYTQQVGSLTVTISPQEAINAGAQWNVDGGAWQNSGGIVSNLLIGTHTVSFRDVSGWAKPGGQTVTISNNQTTSASGTYTQQVGSLTVTISPQEAINAGAQWNVDGGAWQNSGGIVSNLLIGTHTVSFRDVSGWAKPQGNWAVIVYNHTTATGTYTRQMGACCHANGTCTDNVTQANCQAAGDTWHQGVTCDAACPLTGCTTPGLTITSKAGCPLGTAASGASLSGTVTGNWWNETAGVNSITRLVVGFRDPSSGVWTGPEPVDLGISDIPVICSPGESYGSPIWAISAPSANGAYPLYLYLAQAVTASQAITAFKNHNVTGESEREKYLCSSVLVSPIGLGACRVGTSCSIGVTAAWCSSQGGQWFANATCDEIIGNTLLGACCINGNCLRTLQDACSAQGGTWQGESTDCNSAVCPRTCTAQFCGICTAQAMIMSTVCAIGMKLRTRRSCTRGRHAHR